MESSLKSCFFNLLNKIANGMVRIIATIKKMTSNLSGEYSTIHPHFSWILARDQISMKNQFQHQDLLKNTYGFSHFSCEILEDAKNNWIHFYLIRRNMPGHGHWKRQKIYETCVDGLQMKKACDGNKNLLRKENILLPFLNIKHFR